MILRLLPLATLPFLPLLVLPGHAQTTEFGGIRVEQLTSANSAAAVSLTTAPGSSPQFTLTGGNRGDYTVDFGPGADQNAGVLIPCVAELSRDNTAQGDTIGRFYATAATSPDEGGGDYTIAIFTSPGGGEANIHVSAAFFPFNQWLGGTARNTTNNGELTELVGSTGLLMGTHFADQETPNGVSTLSINDLTGNLASQNGVLLVTGAKNEDNFALSKANADGTFTLYCHDNGVDGSSYENDSVSFVYLPQDKVGSNRLTALGRVKGDASLAVSAHAAGKTITATKGGTGIWYLSIAGESDTTGKLIVSPEGGSGNNVDNIVSSAWDAANSRWIIESRDLPAATPGLQNIAVGDDVFSFAFFTAPIAPQVSLLSPAPGLQADAPATVALEASASDADGSVVKVEFLRNGDVIFTDTEAPYTHTDSGLQPGHYDYQARATDNEGTATTTAAAQATVGSAGGGIPGGSAALSFDGVDDYVTMGSAPALNVGQLADTGFTLECWFAREGPGISSGSGSGGVNGVPLFGKGRGESDGTEVDCNIFFGINEEGLLVADFEAHPATGISAGANYPVTASQAPVKDTHWHHAAVTYDHATYTWNLYLDGVRVGGGEAAPEARPRLDSIQHFGIGTALNSTGVPTGAFRGRMDEVRVWNRALSVGEIATGMPQEIMSAPGLLARYGLNEGQGASAASSAGAAPQGTLTNGPIWVQSAPFGPANQPPAVALVSPLQDGTGALPDAVTFEAAASDADGSIERVEFLVNGQKVGEASAAPYVFSWLPPAMGGYEVTARAVDNYGQPTTTAAHMLHILESAGHPAIRLTGPSATTPVPAGSTTLTAAVNDHQGQAMTVTFYGRATTPAVPGPDFSLVQIPDTQFYSQGSASKATNITVEELIGTFGLQTEWVVNNRQARNIVFTSHMGDIVQSGHRSGNNIEWVRASAAMSKLENPATTLLAHGIPYGAAPGNHDIQPIGDYDNGSTAFFNEFFGTQRFAGRTYWGGNYGSDNTNNYQLFSASGLDFIIIHFAYDTTPNAGILNWADALLKAHPHRRAIVTSHSIIGGGNPGNFSAQGRRIYDALKANPNFFLMLCGHIHAEGRRADVYDGRTVYSVLSDYQGAINGGNGFLRVLTFSPASNSIRLESYSPRLGRSVNASDSIPNWENGVTLTYDMQTPVSGWVQLGTTSVPAGGSTATLNWTGLDGARNYEWYAAVSDGNHITSSQPGRFGTAAGQAPAVELTTPQNETSFTTPATIQIAATATDADGQITRVEFYNGHVKLGQDTTAPYGFSWNNVPVGTYDITAVAVDNSNQASLSGVARIVVNPSDFPPSVEMTAPTGGTALPAGSGITLQAAPADPEGPVTRVEFYSGSSYLGAATSAPYSITVSQLAPGRYSYFARAIDSAGQSADSAPVQVAVFVEASPPNVATYNAGTFDIPGWTVARTTPGERAFVLPGTANGVLELRTGGNPVRFASGITLANNWNGPASQAASTSSRDNLCAPFADGSGNLFVNVLDNSNNNAADGNPTTSKQSSGVSVAHLPYSAGWTGASVRADGTISSSNLPTGVRVTKEAESAGVYVIEGLSPAGTLLACTNGETGTSSDNVCSVRLEAGCWTVLVRDNGSGLQDGDFSFVYLPPGTAGVFSAAVSRTAEVTRMNASLAVLGASVVAGTDGMDITFGDGSIINPDTAALFVSADTSSGSRSSVSADNLVCWEPAGNSFRVFAQDLPQINGQHQAIDIHLLALPYEPVTLPVSTVTVTANDATAGEYGADQALSFTVSRTGDASQMLTIPVTWGGTATAGADYSGHAAQVVIPAQQSSASVSLSVLPDSVAEGDETVILSAQSGDFHSVGIPGSAMATLADRPDQAWYFSHITAPNLRTAHGDADNDGLSNLLEYYLGSDPAKAEAASPTGLILSADRRSATFTFPSALERPGVSAEVEWSPDLVHWFISGQGPVQSALSIPVSARSQPGADPQLMQGTATRADGSPLPSPLFFRLKVSP